MTSSAIAVMLVLSVMSAPMARESAGWLLPIVILAGAVLTLPALGAGLIASACAPVQIAERPVLSGLILCLMAFAILMMFFGTVPQVIGPGLFGGAVAIGLFNRRLRPLDLTDPAT